MQQQRSSAFKGLAMNKNGGFIRRVCTIQQLLCENDNDQSTG